MAKHEFVKTKASAFLIALSLLLSGCFVTPGKFVAELVLHEENRFSFTYEGEIFFLGLSSLADMGAEAEEFTPEPCYVDATDRERECSANELSGQRAKWDATAQVRAAEEKQKREQFAAMMGGIDPNDPEATAKLVEHLLRQKGWESVVDKGDGVFDVRYSISGELGHDFMFPMIEGVPTTSPFVQIFLRERNIVRVNAPGFGSQDEANPMGGMMGSLAAFAAMGADEEGSEAPPEIPNIPVAEGTFSITTKGAILANNTDEGPESDGESQILSWEISPRAKSAPTALINLSQ